MATRTWELQGDRWVLEPDPSWWSKHMRWRPVFLVAVLICAGTIAWGFLSSTKESRDFYDSMSAPGFNSKADLPTKYQKIRHGMDVEAVEKILGSRGEELSSSVVPGHGIIIYQWKFGWGKSITCTFESAGYGYLLTHKMQIGLGH